MNCSYSTTVDLKKGDEKQRGREGYMWDGQTFTKTGKCVLIK